MHRVTPQNVIETTNGVILALIGEPSLAAHVWMRAAQDPEVGGGADGRWCTAPCLPAMTHADPWSSSIVGHEHPYRG